MLDNLFLQFTVLTFQVKTYMIISINEEQKGIALNVTPIHDFKK